MDKWLDKHILSPEHKKDLDNLASKYEFLFKMPRKEAEEKAYQVYKREQHIEAAAHHLHGLQNAASFGDKEEGEKHQAMLAMHRKALNENPKSPPGEHITSKKPNKRWTKFNNHSADSLLGK